MKRKRGRPRLDSSPLPTWARSRVAFLARASGVSDNWILDYSLKVGLASARETLSSLIEATKSADTLWESYESEARTLDQYAPESESGNDSEGNPFIGSLGPGPGEDEYGFLGSADRNGLGALEQRPGQLAPSEPAPGSDNPEPTGEQPSTGVVENA